jgi:hypothetical protein
MSDFASESGAFSKWAEEHPLAFKTIAFGAGGLIFVAYRAVIDRLETWLPAWFPPAVLLVLGALLIFQRSRVRVPQDEPESKLFIAIFCVVLGGTMLISFLMSE